MVKDSVPFFPTNEFPGLDVLTQPVQRPGRRWGLRWVGERLAGIEGYDPRSLGWCRGFSKRHGDDENPAATKSVATATNAIGHLPNLSSVNCLVMAF